MPQQMLPDNSSVNPASDAAEEAVGYASFAFAKPRIKFLVDHWNTVSDDEQRWRELRYMRMDKESLNGLGLFKEDETYIAVRLVDTNIKAELPPFVSYVTQSRRSLIFESPVGAPIPGIEKLEHVFTVAARYEGWEKPFIKTADGAISLGWDWVEVELDITKPGHFSVSHVGHSRLLFDQEAENIQDQELVIRLVEYSKINLMDDMRLYQFDPKQVKKILDDTSENQQKIKDILYKVYKVYFKKGGFVYLGWYGGEKTDDWLKVPEPFWLGRCDTTLPPSVKTGKINPANGQEILNYPHLQESEYPFYALPYIESENPKITKLRGRCFLDEPAQEGASALMSAVVNGTMRASNVYGSPAPVNNPVSQLDTAAPKQLDCKLRHGNIYDKPIVFWNPPYPPDTPIKVLEMLATANKAETSQVNYAANNRKDSRKTAEEIKASTQDEQQLTAVQVTTLSGFMRSVYARCYSIYANRVQQAKITVSPDIQALVKGVYVLRAAGDIDVIERQEKMQKLMQSWPVLKGTPIMNEFLKIYLRAAFPDDAETLIPMLDSGNQGKQLVQQLSQLLIHAITQQGPNGQPALKPEYQGMQQQLQQVQQMVQAFLQGGQVAAQPGNDTLGPQLDVQEATQLPAGTTNQ